MQIDPSKPLVFAPADRLSAVEHLAPRFFREVLDRDYQNVMITDESDLCDFITAGAGAEEELIGMLDRLEAHYLIDARPLDSTRIVALLELLGSRGVSE
jgi:hypothetical protein